MAKLDVVPSHAGTVASFVIKDCGNRDPIDEPALRIVLTLLVVHKLPHGHSHVLFEREYPIWMDEGESREPRSGSCEA